MRKGDDGLYGLVKSQLEENPLSGRLFVFAQYLEEFLPRLGGWSINRIAELTPLAWRRARNQAA